MAGSLELIAFDQGRKQFVVKQDAVALLQKLSGPVAVVSVCGRARMGKVGRLHLHQGGMAYKLCATRKSVMRGMCCPHTVQPMLLYLRATVAQPQRQLPLRCMPRHLRTTCTCTLQSTLLNQLVTKLTGAQAKGFTVAATHKPCTKGLHVWSKPIQRTTADGKKMNVVRTRHSLKQAQGVQTHGVMHKFGKELVWTGTQL